MKRLMETLGREPWLRIWRQNVMRVKTHDGRHVSSGIPSGAADLSGILIGGRRLEIETKSSTGTQREDQAHWQRMVDTMGGVYLLCSPSRHLTIRENVDNVLLEVMRSVRC